MIDTLNYILERRCPSGGWCFYQLDEPNAEDTYYALSSLNLMCFDIPDSKTTAFLQNLQESDGTYHGIDACFYCVSGLKLLKGEPLLPVEGFLKETHDQLVKAYESGNFSKDTFLRHSYFYCVLCRLLNIKADPTLTDTIKGINRRSLYLTERFYTTEILAALKEPFSEKELSNFLKMCEDPILGFKESPDTELSYLEQQYMGVKLCIRAGIMPSHPFTIEGFVNSCKRENGGYARSEMGIATLKYTYYGLYITNFLKSINTTSSTIR